MTRACSVVVASLGVAAGLGAGQTTPAELLMRDITREAGVTFQHHAAPEKKYIVESMSGGVALFDFDNDGLIDIYFVDSLTVDTAKDPGAARSALYRNRGKAQFEDVTDKAGVGHPGWGMGVCTADFDGDGWEDMYVTALGGNKLYRNNHDGTFADVTERARVGMGGWSTGCGFADYDRDGDLDLFVSRYVKVDLGNLPQFGRDKTCEYRGVSVQCGPRGLPGESDVLFRNDGGTFTDVSERAGVSDPRAYFGLGVAGFDCNQDGWMDLYVANDSTPNFLYVNQKDGTFKDYNALYHNDGDHFTDVSFRSKTAASSLPYVGWGNRFFDYDNDGLLDLIVVNGHVYPQLDKARLRGSAGYRQRKLLYHNRGDGMFDEVGARYGAAITEERVSRGLAVGDLDNDGRLDVVTNDLDGSPQVLHNELASPGNWLLVRIRGLGMNTGAVGAVVTVRAGALTQRRLVQSGSSYLSQEDKRLHFGLGKAGQVDALEVTWPDGTTTAQHNVKANQLVQIEQAR